MNTLRLYLDDIGKIKVLKDDEVIMHSKNLELFDQISFLKRIELIDDTMTNDVQEIVDLDIIFASLKDSNYEEVINSLLNLFKNKDQYKTYYLKLKKYKMLSLKLGRALNENELKEYFNIENKEKLNSRSLLSQIKKYILYQSSFDAMFEHNLRLVITVVKKYALNEDEFLELINVGNLGLRRAIQKYDYRVSKFSTYATNWIEWRITKYKYSHYCPTTTSIALGRRLYDFNKKVLELEQTKGHKPTSLEISQKLNMPIEKVDEYLSLINGADSLDKYVGEDEDATLEDFIPSDINTEEYFMHQCDLNSLNEILNSLGEREREIIKYRFGIGYSKEHTLEETGEKFGDLTRERIRQIVKTQLKIMNKRAKNKI